MEAAGLTAHCNAHTIRAVRFQPNDTLRPGVKTQGITWWWVSLRMSNVEQPSSPRDVRIRLVNQIHRTVWLRIADDDVKGPYSDFACSECGERFSRIEAQPEAVWALFNAHAYQQHPDLVAIEKRQRS
jgi:hypothetical protein